MARAESIKADVIDRPGRPRKRAAILHAATALFLRAGYGAATMDAIAREAGVSKQTIYHHFGSKETLFGAIVGELCDRLLTPLQPAPQQESSDVRAVLVSLARQVLNLALAPDSLALHRLIVAETPRFPELGTIAYQSGPRVAVQALAGYLGRQKENGVLYVDDPKLAAELFFGMVLGHFQLRALLCNEHPAKDKIDRAVAQVADTFLAGRR